MDDINHRYSIKDLERLSGIKAHTIRIWEQRYNLLTPDRTDTNIRTYSNDDLKHLLNITLLNNHGIKISKISELSPDEIKNKVNSLLTQTKPAEEQINSLIVSMVEMNEDVFNDILTVCDRDYGFERMVLEVLYPFLERIGIMWQTGSINPAQEHFISNLIRQKFIVAIDRIRSNQSTASKKVVLYLPEGELHEISLLFYNYLLKNSGIHTVYLGQSVPFSDLNAVIDIVKPDALLTCFTTQMDIPVQQYIYKLRTIFPQGKLIFHGLLLRSAEIQLPEQTYAPQSIDDVKNLLKDL